MVALLVKLKVTLFLRGLKRSTARLVVTVIAWAFGSAFCAAAVAALVALRGADRALAGPALVLIGVALTVGWIVLPLLVVGIDETLEPVRFALLPLSAKELMPGLFAAGVLSGGSLASLAVSLGTFAVWTTSLPTFLAAFVGASLGLAICYLVGKVLTSAFAAALASRRFRDSALVILSISGMGVGVAGQAIGSFAPDDPAQLVAFLTEGAALAGWTPLGWAWAIPWDVEHGRWLSALARMALAGASVAGLWRAWEHFLDRALTSPLLIGGGGSVRSSGQLDRVFGASPVGAVAARSIRYWRRDPRRLVAMVGLLMLPVIVLASTSMGTATVSGSPDTTSLALLLTIPFLGVMMGPTVAFDVSYDGSAVWTHVASGIRGWEDRLGRILGASVFVVPLVTVVAIGSLALGGRWDLWPVAGSLAVAGVSGALGIGSLTGAWWQVAVPPSGQNPFSKGAGGSAVSMLIGLVTMVLTGISLVPLGGLLIACRVLGWPYWYAAPASLAIGAFSLWLGIWMGGRRLERDWPEVLRAVTWERA